MKRRTFLKKIPVAASLPFAISGIPLKVMGENTLTRLARMATSEEKVMIILQLHGGNDGLNSLIPVTDYDLYYSRRANIAIPAKNSLRKYIPLDSTLPPDAQIGLHPDMQGAKTLYDTGRAAFIQGVSYENNNGSHFRGRDIQFMGGSADDYFDSGWVGRYLNKLYPNYPEAYPTDEMPDPLGIEMGNDVSLIFHQSGNIPTSISLPDNLESFVDLVDTLPGYQEGVADPRGIPPEAVENSSYWKEMNWILGLEEKTDDYAQRLYEVWQAGGDKGIAYPETYPLNAPRGSKNNPLSAQLQLVARLLGGGSKTKVFMVRIGGFDTHADQTTNYDPTMGIHAALMYHISAAMQAFQNDLKARGIEDNVLTVTTSEFGRRVHSNGSYGTDHGTGGPIYLFGKGVKSGVFGKVPDMTKDNVEQQFDYREVYANILRDWMGVSENDVNDIFHGDYLHGPLGTLISNVVTGEKDNFISERYNLEQNFPNPVKDATTIGFRINNRLHVTIELYDTQGSSIKNLVNAAYEPGHHTVPVNMVGIQPGTYIYQLKAGNFKASRKMIVTK